VRATGPSTDLILIVAGVAAIATVTAISALIVPADAAPQAQGSTYSATPSGAKAAYLLLVRIGRQPRRSFDPLTSVDVDPRSTTLILVDPGQPGSDLDRTALRRFVEAGGRVLATGPGALPLLPGMTRRPAPGPAQLRQFTAAVPGEVTTEPTLELSATPQRVTSEPSWVPVYGTSDDPGVMTARMGEGVIVWWASSRPLSNGAIAEAGHLRLFLSSIGSGRQVLWDEYYHGHARSFWSYLARTPLAWSGAQFGLMLALAVFSFSRRRGPVRPHGGPPRTSPIEFIETMGSLYARSGDASAAVAAARARLRRVLIAVSGLPPGVSDDRLVASSVARTGADRAILTSVLESSRLAAGDPRLNDREALALVSAIQSEAARLRAASRDGSAGQARSRTTPGRRHNQ
jgi:hypothetical protein